MLKSYHLSEEAIATLLSKEHKPSEPPVNGYRKAAVLIPLIKRNQDWEILFTRRTQSVQYHKGQVSFPGGAIEPGDIDIIQTALRETEEEIGLPGEVVRVLGAMDTMPTPTGYLISPVVGCVMEKQAWVLSEAEVERVFTVPIDWLANPLNWEERDFVRTDGSVENLVFYKPYSGEIIWGITGRIVLNFLTLLGLK